MPLSGWECYLEECRMSVRSVLLAAALLSGFWTAAQAQDYAYVANSRDHTVSVISTATNTILSTIQVGAIPEGVAVMPDGSKAYVTNFDDGTVSVIDAKTSSVVATIAVGNDSLYPAITPDGSKLYVTQDGPVAVISTATNTVSTTIPSITAIAVAVAPDGSKVYFANNNDISVVDTATNAVLATIPVGLAPFDLAVSPDGTRIYVANFSADTVSVIGTATNTVLATIQGLDQPANVAITPDGRTVYVTNQGGSDTVSVISTATNQIIATIPVGDLPAGVAVTRDGTLAYVPVHNENDAAVIGTATNKVVATIAVGGLPGSLGKFIGPSPAAPPAAGAEHAGKSVRRAAAVFRFRRREFEQPTAQSSAHHTVEHDDRGFLRQYFRADRAALHRAAADPAGDGHDHGHSGCAQCRPVLRNRRFLSNRLLVVFRRAGTVLPNRDRELYWRHHVSGLRGQRQNACGHRRDRAGQYRRLRHQRCPSRPGAVLRPVDEVAAHRPTRAGRFEAVGPMVLLRQRSDVRRLDQIADRRAERPQSSSRSTGCRLASAVTE
ncbi:MAG: YncE family protein [Aliidongia sp.]